MSRRVKNILFALSHNRSFLWTMVVGIFLAGIIMANVLYWVFPPTQEPGMRIMTYVGQGDEAGALEYFSTLLEPQGAKFEDVLAVSSLVASSFSQEARQQAVQRIKNSSLDTDAKELAVGLLESLAEPGEAADSRLVDRAWKEPPVRYANQALAIFWMYTGKLEQAAVAYEKEGVFSEAHLSRTRAIQLYLQLEKLEEVYRLQKIPAYKSAFTSQVHFSIALAEKDWPGMIRWLIPSQHSQTPWPLLLLAVFAGLVWLSISLQAAQVEPGLSMRLFLCLAGLGLGILSTIPTVLTAIWQEEILGFTMSVDLVGGLIYFVAGVGLREEVWKLIFFLPLVPILVKRRDPLEMLMVAACVGLGFAAEENVQYFRQSTMAAPSRFLTANFFHMALTGIAGLYLCRAVRSPRHGIVDFLSVFFVIIVVHGVYDALISVPPLMEYSLFSISAFILLSFQFFHELHEFREPRQETVSLTAHFLFGLSCLAAFTFILVSRQLGPVFAIQVLVPTLLEMALVAYMFLREFREAIR